MKYLMPLVTTLAVIFVVGLSIVVVTFTPDYEKCRGETQTNNSNNAQTPPQQHAAGFLSCTAQVIETHSEIATATGTVIIAIFTIVLAWVTYSQASLARESFVADKRAFIFPIGIRHEVTRQPPYDWRFRPNWRNSGDTQSRRLRVHVECILQNTPLREGYTASDNPPRTGSGLLYPKSEAFIGYAPTPPTPGISAQDLADVIRSTKYLYLVGWARYRDVFPGTKERITRFCWQLAPDGDPINFDPAINVINFGFFTMPTGNCADEDCNC